VGAFWAWGSYGWGYVKAKLGSDLLRDLFFLAGIAPKGTNSKAIVHFIAVFSSFRRPAVVTSVPAAAAAAAGGGEQASSSDDGSGRATRTIKPLQQ